MITINFNNTTIDVIEEDSSYRYRSLMGENNITLKFLLPEYIEIPVGAWCEYMGERYTLVYPPNIIKNGVRYFEYTLIMEGEQYMLFRYILRNTADRRIKFSLCSTPNEYIQLIIDNLNQRDSDSGWKVGNCIDASEKTIAFDATNIRDALQNIADTFETEWEIVGKTVHLKKVEYFKDDPLPLSYGKGNGFVPGVGRTTESGSLPIDILYVQGGTRNIDRSKYGSQFLLLPKGQTLEYEGHEYITDDDGYYIRRVDNTSVNENEGCMEYSDIYPCATHMVKRVEIENEEKHWYNIIINAPENLDYKQYQIAGEIPTVIFQTGMLSGREFDLETDDSGNLICEKVTDIENGISVFRGWRFQIVPIEEDGMIFPDIDNGYIMKGDWEEKNGDTLRIFGIMLPDAYICDNENKSGASWDMFREAVKHLYDNEDYKFTFKGELQGLWAKRNWVNVGGHLKVGAYILFSDEQFAKDGISIRITGIKDYLTSPYSPTIELSNNISTKSLSSEISEIHNESVIASDNNSSLLSFTKRRFRDTVETISMLEDALPTYFKNFSEAINPITLQTMIALIGDESLQFRFVTNMTNPVVKPHNVTYDDTTKQLTSPAGILQHMTLGIDTITSYHSISEYRFWNIPSFTSAVLDQPNTKYYLYAIVNLDDNNGHFYLSENVLPINEYDDSYCLLMGVLNSEFEGARSYVSLYGFTEILPGQVTTDKVVSADGESYIDFVNNAARLGGNNSSLEYNVNNDGILRLKGTLVQNDGGDTAEIGCFRGQYSPTYTYYKADEVLYNANGNTATYRCISELPITGHPPTDNTRWKIYAQGADGQDGKDGADGQNGIDGNYFEYRYAKNGSATIAPDINVTAVNPDGWSTTLPYVSSVEYLWMTIAKKNADGSKLLQNWSTPCRIKGDNGSITKYNLLIGTNQGVTHWKVNANSGTLYTLQEDNFFGVRGIKISLQQAASQWCILEYINISKSLKLGKSYSFSIDIKSNKDVELLFKICNEDNTGNFTGSKYVTLTAGVASHLEFVFPTGDTEYSNQILYISGFGNINGIEIAIANLKLEDGDKSTPYAPAIDDQRGASAVYRGIYEQDKQYYGGFYRLDVVKYNDSYYVARSDAGTFYGKIPTDNLYWNTFGAQFESVATDLLLAENANIGNLIFKDEKMVSQTTDATDNPNIEIDGKNGLMTVRGSIFNAFKIINGQNYSSFIDEETGYFDIRNSGLKLMIENFGESGVMIYLPGELKYTGCECEIFNNTGSSIGITGAALNIEWDNMDAESFKNAIAYSPILSKYTYIKFQCLNVKTRAVNKPDYNYIDSTAGGESSYVFWIVVEQKKFVD